MRRARINTYASGLIAAFLLFLVGPNVEAQQPQRPPTPPHAVQSEDDPTRPIVFSIRNEHRDISGDAWANTTIFRFDKLILTGIGAKGGAKGFIVRFDLPFLATHAGDKTESGLGDIYAQVLYSPKASPRFTLAAGGGVFIPTATGDTHGRGKLILSPTVVPIWYFAQRRRFFLVRIQEQFSVAGKSDRPGVNYFIAAPALAHALTRKWWMLVDTELKWDWKSDKASGISGIQVGRMMKGNFGIWVKPEVSWGPGRLADFTFKFTLFRIR